MNAACQEKVIPKYPPATKMYHIYKSKKLLSSVSYEQKQKDTGQCMVQESIYAAAMAVNDDIVLRLCENYNFFVAEARYHKECYIQYINQAKQNKGSKTKDAVQKSQYEISKKETMTCLMKYIRKKILCKKQPVLMTDFISNFERTLNDENGFTLER